MKEQAPSKSEDKFVNYAPAMPTLSSSPGLLERFVRTVFRRRGGIRPVARQGEHVVVDTSER